MGIPTNIIFKGQVNLLGLAAAVGRWSREWHFTVGMGCHVGATRAFAGGRCLGRKDGEQKGGRGSSKGKKKGEGQRQHNVVWQLRKQKCTGSDPDAIAM